MSRPNHITLLLWWDLSVCQSNNCKTTNSATSHDTRYNENKEMTGNAATLQGNVHANIVNRFSQQEIVYDANARTASSQISIWRIYGESAKDFPNYVLRWPSPLGPHQSPRHVQMLMTTPMVATTRECYKSLGGNVSRKQLMEHLRWSGNQSKNEPWCKKRARSCQDAFVVRYVHVETLVSYFHLYEMNKSSNWGKESTFWPKESTKADGEQKEVLTT